MASARTTTPCSRAATRPPTDGDADGMPDAWETEHGLDPADPSDGPAIAEGGYSNVEVYLNELAALRIGQ